MYRSLLWVSLLLLVTLSCRSAEPEEKGDERRTITNPIAEKSADPWVIQWEGEYYYMWTTSEDLRVSRASKLQNIGDSTVTVWKPPRDMMYSHSLWAPELHYLQGRWYIYFAADDGDNKNHRMYVLEGDTQDPQGNYTFKGKIAAPSDHWAIDGTVLKHEGQLYFIWSGWEGTENGQNLYIAPMKNPWTIGGERTRIAEPRYDWEKHGLPINEGPQVLRSEDNLFITYSASGYWTPEYSIGLLIYTGGDVTDSGVWKKRPAPVFTGVDTEVQGTGHASFTKSCDGTEHWIVYHAHRPGDAPARDLRMQPFTFKSNGEPNFGRPVSPGEPVAVPAGC